MNSLIPKGREHSNPELGNKVSRTLPWIVFTRIEFEFSWKIRQRGTHLPLNSQNWTDQSNPKKEKRKPSRFFFWMSLVHENRAESNWTEVCVINSSYLSIFLKKKKTIFLFIRRTKLETIFLYCSKQKKYFNSLLRFFTLSDH
jgi:hypothetical protein